MAMPFQPWREKLVPASFRGAPFKVEAGAMPTGRRNAVHEFAKRDLPFAEDMGRRARRYTIAGYVIGPDYIAQRDALIAACEAGGTGTLVHPTLGNMLVNCEACVPSEVRERGGICTFEMAFVETGSLDYGSSPDTQAQAQSAAKTLGKTSADSLDRSLGSSSGTIST